MIADILDRVAADFGLDTSDLLGRARPAAIVRARHTAALLLRLDAHLSYPAIGRALGGRDHSTAHTAVQRMHGLCMDSPAYRERVARLRGVDPGLARVPREIL